MKRLGLDLDGSSSGALMKSFTSVTDKNERLTLQHLSTRSMQRAKYFCTGSLDISKYAHYALSVPLYTHFTSPIRRYADVMVHRQLEAILQHEQQASLSSPGGAGGEFKFSLDTETVAKIAQVCNTKKEAARLAQEQSQHLFLCVLIADLTKRYGPVIRTATVIGVLDQAYDVLVPEFGQLEKRLRIADLPTEVSSIFTSLMKRMLTPLLSLVQSFMYDEHTNSLTIYWKKGVDVLSYLVENNQDDHLARLHSQVQHHAKMMESSSKQADAEKGLFDDEDEQDDSAQGFSDAEKKSASTEQHLKSRDVSCYWLIYACSSTDRWLRIQRAPLKFDGLSTKDGHACQTISELHEVPVIISVSFANLPIDLSADHSLSHRPT